MNYRHAFHAGNLSDVLKHAVLTLLLRHLCAKPAPFCVLDTHAGIGRYDLSGDEAQRTGEAEAGIRRLLQAPSVPADLEPYLSAVRSLNPAGQKLRWYPGSPRLARHFLRPQDRLILTELHPADVVTLRNEFRNDSQTAIHHMDGWMALKAHLPPAEKRGLVLIDPPFEAPDEYQRCAEGLRLAHRRWPTGQLVLWYPIKDRAAVWTLQQTLEDSGIRRILAAELLWQNEDRADRLNGCGLLLINPPWQLDQTLTALLPELHRLLADGRGGSSVSWIVPE
jgi:23S rRNA (adenine2030-N6)-methyltransferase